MPQIGLALRWCCTALLLAGLAAGLSACGRGKNKEMEMSAAPVRLVAASLAKPGHWTAGQCLCVAHFGKEAVEDFPAGVLDDEFARHKFLRKWSACVPFYGKMKSLKGCEQGMADYICAVADRKDMPKDTKRVLCHVNGESEALQREGYLQDEFDVVEKDGRYEVHAVSLAGSEMIHE